jgi:hypothetical protein
MPDEFATYFSGFDAQHHLRTTTGDGRVLYVLTGVALIRDFHGTSDSAWVHGQLDFDVPIPDLPAGQGLRLAHWTTFAGLNAVANDGEGDDIAFAVDNFWLTETDRALRSARMHCGIAVRDVDGWLLRVGYNLNLLGTIEPTDPIR